MPDADQNANQMHASVSSLPSPKQVLSDSLGCNSILYDPVQAQGLVMVVALV